MNSRHEVMDVQPIPVSIVKTTEELSGLGVEFGATSQWSIPLIGTQQPVQILQRRPTRYKAVIYVPSLVTVAAAPVNVATGAIAAGAGSAALPAVAQSVTGFTLSFSAAPSTAGTAVLSNVQGGPFTFNIPSGQTSPYTVTFPTPIVGTGAAPTLTITGLGTGAGTIELFSSGTVATSASGLALAYRPEYLANPNNPQGYIISTTPHLFQWENQQPCYAIAIGAGPVLVNTVDQAQAAAQATAEEAVQAADFEHERNQEESGNERERTTANQY